MGDSDLVPLLRSEVEKRRKASGGSVWKTWWKDCKSQEGACDRLFKAAEDRWQSGDEHSFGEAVEIEFMHANVPLTHKGRNLKKDPFVVLPHSRMSCARVPQECRRALSTRNALTVRMGWSGTVAT